MLQSLSPTQFIMVLLSLALLIFSFDFKTKRLNKFVFGISIVSLGISTFGVWYGYITEDLIRWVALVVVLFLFATSYDSLNRKFKKNQLKIVGLAVVFLAMTFWNSFFEKNLNNLMFNLVNVIRWGVLVIAIYLIFTSYDQMWGRFKKNQIKVAILSLLFLAFTVWSSFFKESLDKFLSALMVFAGKVGSLIPCENEVLIGAIVILALLILIINWVSQLLEKDVVF